MNNRELLQLVLGKPEVFGHPNEEDLLLIKAIVKRASKLCERPTQFLFLDLIACHAHNPLNLKNLHDAQRQPFMADLACISHCIDHDTGKLQGNFKPRCSL